MTNLSKFAAQQLTKKQMNDVKGGAYQSTRDWQCFVVTGEDANGDNVGYWVSVPNVSDAYEASEILIKERPSGAIQINC